MMHTEIGDPDKADDAEVAVDEELEEELSEEIPEETVVLPEEDTVVLPEEDTVVLPEEDTVVLPEEDTVVLPEEDTVVLPETENSDNVGDVSVEINVEELVAEIEASQGDDAHRKKEIRKRLEEIQEQKRASREIGDTFNIDLDEDD